MAPTPEAPKEKKLQENQPATQKKGKPKNDRKEQLAIWKEQKKEQKNKVAACKPKGKPAWQTVGSSKGKEIAATRTVAAPRASVPAASKPAGAETGKARPAWDLKAKVEDMEGLFEANNRRLEALEAEKQELQENVEVKHEVVVKSSEEIKGLQKKIDSSDELLNSLKASLAEKEEIFSKETSRLKRALEEEEFNRSSLQRKLTALEDELSAKQTEVLGLKTSVAKLSSSQAVLEASLAGSKLELEASRPRVLELTKESEQKSVALAEGLKIQEEQSTKLWGEETERRRLHNIIQELKGNIRVFSRHSWSQADP